MRILIYAIYSLLFDKYVCVLVGIFTSVWCSSLHCLSDNAHFPLNLSIPFHIELHATCAKIDVMTQARLWSPTCLRSSGAFRKQQCMMGETYLIGPLFLYTEISRQEQCMMGETHLIWPLFLYTEVSQEGTVQLEDGSDDLWQFGEELWMMVVKM